MLTGDQNHPKGDWEVNSDFSGRFGVLDLSLQDGGDWTPDHESHQNGLDVDIRYVRKDREETPLNLAENLEEFDVVATVKLFEALWYGSDGSYTHIFVDALTGIQEKESPYIIEHLAGHHHHFHVRIKDPDGTEN